MSMVDFLWLIHFGLLALYIYETWTFFDRKRLYGSRLKNLEKHGRELFQETMEHPTTKGAFPIVAGHVIILGLVTEQVPIFTLAAAVAGLVLGGHNAVTNDIVKRWKLEEESRTANSGQANAHTEDEFAGAGSDDDFGFDDNTFNGKQRSQRYNKTEAEADQKADYEAAMSWAVNEANKISNEVAEAAAKRMDRKAAKPGLHPRDVMQFSILASLLRERVKGWKGQARTASDEEIDQLLLETK